MRKGIARGMGKLFPISALPSPRDLGMLHGPGKLRRRQGIQGIFLETGKSALALQPCQPIEPTRIRLRMRDFKLCPIVSARRNRCFATGIDVYLISKLLRYFGFA